MADVRHFQYLEQIRDMLGFPVGFAGLTASGVSAVAGELAHLNTTASLMLPGIRQTASNVSAVGLQLTVLNSTASNSDSYLQRLRNELQNFRHCAASGVTVAQVSNPVVGETTLVAGASFEHIFVHSMTFRGAVLHASPSRQFTLRQGSSGTDKFSGHVGASNAGNGGVFEHTWNFTDSPWQLPVATGLIINVATGFTATCMFSTVYHRTSA